MKGRLSLLVAGSRAQWVAAGVVVLVALALPPLAGALESAFPDQVSANFMLVLGVSALVLGLWSTSYNLMLGQTGMVSFAHAAYYGVGAYTVALLFERLHWPVLAGLAVSPVVAALIGLVTGAVSLRAVRLYFSLLTLAISQVAFVIAFEWYSFTGGDNGIHGLSVPDAISDPTVLYYFIAAVVAVCLLAMFILTRSPFGAALLSIRENRLRAAFVGLNVKRYELAVFTIASAFAGIAGALYAIYDLQAYPNLMYWTASAQPIVVTLLGGTSSFLGPAVGAALFVGLQNTIGRDFPSQFEVVLGVVVLAVVLAVPGGIASVVDHVRLPGRRPPLAPAESLGDAIAHAEVTAGGGLGPAAAEEARPTGAPPLLAVEGISRRFGGLRAVNGVSLELRSGERHAVIGPNGAGKSTLFNLITGHLLPDSGRVLFDGRPITGRPPYALARLGIGRAFQITNIFPKLTVRENVQYAMLAHRRLTTRPFGLAAAMFREEAGDLLDAVGLTPYANAQAGLLSHGDQRALELAISLALGTRLLLLDEPTAGMSPYETRRAMDLVREAVASRGLTLLFCEHDMEVVFGTAERVTVMHQGAVIASGTPEQVRADPNVQRVYLGDVDSGEAAGA